MKIHYNVRQLDAVTMAEEEEEVLEELITGVSSDEDEGNETINCFYSPALLSYLLVKVLPYTPMLDHSMFVVKGMAITNDTNAAVEA